MKMLLMIVMLIASTCSLAVSVFQENTLENENFVNWGFAKSILVESVSFSRKDLFSKIEVTVKYQADGVKLTKNIFVTTIKRVGSYYSVAGVLDSQNVEEADSDARDIRSTLIRFRTSADGDWISDLVVTAERSYTADWMHGQTSTQTFDYTEEN